MQNVVIVPTVLAENKEEFFRQIETLSPLSYRLQIDVADGLLVENTTVDLRFITAELLQNASLYKNKTFDFHLMVKDWEKAVEEISKIKEQVNINLILPHYSVFTLQALKDQILKIGITFNPEEDIDINLAMQLPAIQIMTVRPGKQGGQFLPEALTKIQYLRDLGFEGEILIDGGVNDKTLPTILSQAELPDVVGVGSYLTRAENPRLNYQKLNSLIHSSLR